MTLPAALYRRYLYNEWHDDDKPPRRWKQVVAWLVVGLIVYSIWKNTH